MLMPKHINRSGGYKVGKCGKYSRDSVEKPPQLRQNINLNSLVVDEC